MTRALPSLLDVALHAVHIWTWGLYAGSLAYCYLRLFPDMRRWLASEERYEEFSLTTSHGLRWWIYGSLGLAGASGGALLVRSGPHGPAFDLLIAGKFGLLAVSVALYTYVSYVMWPRRVFVAAAHRSAEQRRFFRVALGLVGLLLGQALLGAAAHLF